MLLRRGGGEEVWRRGDRCTRSNTYSNARTVSKLGLELVRKFVPASSLLFHPCTIELRIQFGLLPPASLLNVNIYRNFNGSLLSSKFSRNNNNLDKLITRAHRFFLETQRYFRSFPISIHPRWACTNEARNLYEAGEMYGNERANIGPPIN